jgi:hypothetical protein
MYTKLNASRSYLYNVAKSADIGHVNRKVNDAGKYIKAKSFIRKIIDPL